MVQIITLFGLPPKFAMLSRTHSSAARQSSMPTFAELFSSGPPKADKSR